MNRRMKKTFFRENLRKQGVDCLLDQNNNRRDYDVKVIVPVYYRGKTD